MISRLLRFAFLSLALATTAAFAADLTITPIFTGWREAGSFKRISEYFSGKENTGGQTVLRTHSGQRSGYYFQMRIATADSTEAKVVLQVITPDNATPRVFNFSTSLTSPKTMINLGLTGADWPDAKVNPVAWRLEIYSREGKLLATENSYLWEKPAGK